jgi:hypothetical protein
MEKIWKAREKRGRPGGSRRVVVDRALSGSIADLIIAAVKATLDMGRRGFLGRTRDALDAVEVDERISARVDERPVGPTIAFAAKRSSAQKHQGAVTL